MRISDWSSDVCSSDLIGSFSRAGGIVLMGLAVYCLATGAALRFLCAFFVLVLAYQLTWPDYLDAMPLDLLDGGSASTLAYFPAYLRLWWLAVAAVLALVVAQRAGKDRKSTRLNSSH